MEDNMDGFGFGAEPSSGSTPKPEGARVPVPVKPSKPARTGVRGGLPWPDPFPDFVGVIVDLVDDEWEGDRRTDKEWNPNYDPDASHTPTPLVQQIEQYGMEFHPNAARHPDIARAWYKETNVALPKEVPAGSKCESLPLSGSISWPPTSGTAQAHLTVTFWWPSCSHRHFHQDRPFYSNP